MAADTDNAGLRPTQAEDFSQSIFAIQGQATKLASAFDRYIRYVTERVGKVDPASNAALYRDALIDRLRNAKQMLTSPTGIPYLTIAQAVKEVADFETGYNASDATWKGKNFALAATTAGISGGVTAAAVAGGASVVGGVILAVPAALVSWSEIPGGLSRMFVGKDAQAGATYWTKGSSNADAVIDSFFSLIDTSNAKVAVWDTALQQANEVSIKDMFSRGALLKNWELNRPGAEVTARQKWLPWTSDREWGISRYSAAISMINDMAEEATKMKIVANAIANESTGFNERNRAWTERLKKGRPSEKELKEFQKAAFDHKQLVATYLQTSEKQLYTMAQMDPRSPDFALRSSQIRRDVEATTKSVKGAQSAQRLLLDEEAKSFDRFQDWLGSGTENSKMFVQLAKEVGKLKDYAQLDHAGLSEKVTKDLVREFTGYKSENEAAQNLMKRYRREFATEALPSLDGDEMRDGLNAMVIEQYAEGGIRSEVIDAMRYEKNPKRYNQFGAAVVRSIADRFNTTRNAAIYDAVVKGDEESKKEVQRLQDIGLLDSATLYNIESFARLNQKALKTAERLSLTSTADGSLVPRDRITGGPIDEERMRAFAVNWNKWKTLADHLQKSGDLTQEQIERFLPRQHYDTYERILNGFDNFYKDMVPTVVKAEDRTPIASGRTVIKNPRVTGTQSYKSTALTSEQALGLPEPISAERKLNTKGMSASQSAILRPVGSGTEDLTKGLIPGVEPEVPPAEEMIRTGVEDINKKRNKGI